MPADGALDAVAATEAGTATTDADAPALEPDDRAPESGGADNSGAHDEGGRDAGTQDAGHGWAVVKVRNVKIEFPSTHALVVLREIDESRRELTIAIGIPEATALGHAWRQIPTPRPLTHELFADVLTRLGATLEVVRLTGRVAGVVSAEMEISSPRGREKVPCRPTDGLTLAYRQGVKAPILADDRLFDPDADVEPSRS
jgi:hypothetical protein